MANAPMLKCNHSEFDSTQRATAAYQGTVAESQIAAMSAPALPQAPSAEQGFKRRRLAATTREQEQSMLEELFRLLQQLPATRRRQIIGQSMTQEERVRLETWCVAAKHAQHRWSKTLLPGAAVRGAPQAAKTPRTWQDAPPPPSLEVNKAPPSAAAPRECEMKLLNDIEFQDAEEPKRKATRRLWIPRKVVGKSASTGGVNYGKKARVQCRGRGERRFSASVCTRSFCFESKEFHLQQDAEAALGVLRAIKMGVVSALASYSAQRLPTGMFKEVTRKVVSETLAEKDIMAEDIGLRFRVQLHVRGWLQPPVSTPFHTCLDAALKDWEALAAFASTTTRSSSSDRADGCRAPPAAESTFAEPTWLSPCEAHDRWLQFREVYLDVVEGHGMNRAQAADRLQSLSAQSRAWREQRWERWNRRCMESEDPSRGRRLVRRCVSLSTNLQKRSTVAEAQRLAALQAREAARRLNAERKAMHDEDVRAKACRRQEKVLARQERRLCSRIESILATWRKQRIVKPAPTGASLSCKRLKRVMVATA
mmetsp:Transcript_25714/g.59439  ORF Transcript_25714/g.59439 Transcript_25714/m.59439 type:complete len:538 (+) Transcript_25714:233-1846(+)